MERPRVPKGPKAPSSAELEEHLATAHAVHRSWCGHCMRARATWDRHLEVQDSEEGDPTLSMDYFSFGEQEAEETTSLVIVVQTAKASTHFCRHAHKALEPNPTVCVEVPKLMKPS